MRSTPSSPSPEAPKPGMRGAARYLARLRQLFLRRLSSSLTRRIVLLNLAGLAAMFLGFLWLNQTRLGVIDARSQSLSLQAEIIAAAIAGATNIDAGSLALDPEKLLQQQLGEALPRDDVPLPWLEFSINPTRVAPILKRLVSPTRTRARVYDQDGFLLLDTRAFYSPGDFIDAKPSATQDSTLPLFERSWNAVKRSFGRVDLGAGDDSSGTRQLQEVQRALGGNASARVRVSADGQTIVYAATPIQRFQSIRGALLLSTQEGDVDQVIADERWSIVLVFLIAAGVMLVLSVLLAGTIAEPVRKLSEAADRVRRGTRARQEIPDFSYRSDEIGHLSSSLRDMTAALFSRIEAIERFAADVAHELKNPLTSLRSAVETLPLARSAENQAKLTAIIIHDVKRLDRLITDISDASRLDAELQRGDTGPVRLAALLQTVVAMRNEVHRPGDARVSLDIVPDLRGEEAFLVEGHDSRLVQVFDNLINNAVSFSPREGNVRIALQRLKSVVEVQIEDDGPGIPDHALVRIFERFYTDRPEQGFGQNSGLGLAISKQIIEAHGGGITAENRRDSAGKTIGARFVIRLPTGGAS